MNINNAQGTTFLDYKVLFPYVEEEYMIASLEYLNNAPKPDFIFGSVIPNDFNLIDFGTYSDLCEALGCKDHFEMCESVCKLIFHDITQEDIDNASVYDIFGFVNWAVKEVGRINELFSNIKVEYTEQERKAGIEKLQFGTFGILDWYARRMGIHDQNEVNKEKWVRIWQCMKNDNEETAYNRRLQKVYEQDAKHKH